MGLTKLRAGGIRIIDQNVSSMTAHERPALGIGFMPEERRLVPQLTVEENVLLPAWANPAIDATRQLEIIDGLMPEIAAMRTRKSRRTGSYCYWMNLSKAWHRHWPIAYPKLSSHCVQRSALY